MPSAISKSKLKHSWRFEAIGTQWSVETEKDLGATRQKIENCIENYNRIYSRFRDDSLVSQLAQRPGKYQFPEHVKPLIAFYQQLYEITDGAVSPLVGRLLESVGYDKQYSLLAQQTLEQTPRWEEAMAWSGPTVTTKLPVLLDFGAAGKGYLVDMIAEILDQDDFGAYIVDASGDVRVKATEQTVGLENPYDESMVIGVAQLNDMSLCASASNRRVWGGWHHIINPRTNRPVDEIVATWVIAPDALYADGLATALFFVGANRLQQWKFDYVRLFADGTVEHSPGFVGELFV